MAIPNRTFAGTPAGKGNTSSFLFGRLARVVITHRRLVLGAWLLLAIAVIPFAPRLGEVTSADEAGFLPGHYESVLAAKLAGEAFPDAVGTSGILVFSGRDGSRLGSVEKEAIRQALARIPGRLADTDAGRVVRIGPAVQSSPDGLLQLARVNLRDEPGAAGVLEAAERVREAATAEVKGDGLTVRMTGSVAVMLDDQKAHDTAAKTVGIATVILIFSLLFLTFRSPVAALLPLLAIALVFLLAGSFIAIVARTFDFSLGLDLPPLLTVVLFGIGTDYILFTLFRFREELRSGLYKGQEALVRAAEKTGEVITFAALVVMVAFAALGLSGLGSLRAMAPGLIIGVGVMWFAGVTLVPALLAFTGPRVFWPSCNWQKRPDRPFYHRVGSAISSWPGRTALVAGGLMLTLALGSLAHQTDYDAIGQLPADAEARLAFEQMRESIPAGALAPVEVYLSGEEQLDRQRVQSLFRGDDHPEGIAETMPVRFSPDGRTARIDVVLAGNPYSNEAVDLVAGPLRDAARRSGLADRVLVGGQTATSADLRSATNRDYRLVFPVAAVLILLLLAWLLRSLVAPLYLLGAVMLGFAATLGVSATVFIGIMGEAGLKSILPVIAYLFVVAVGTDYSILVVSRIREEMAAGRPARAATASGIEHAGPAVAAAGIVLAGTFTSLVLTGISSLMQIGLTVSAGILIVSLVMATVLVPAITALAGRRAWWPGRLARDGDQHEQE